MIFSSKYDLFRKADISELQENLNLYLDNELPAADRSALETLVNSDVEASRELDLLRLTRLEKEEIRFANKQSLYRTEGTRVISMRWWRAAAAAVLLGFGLWTGVSIYRNSVKANPTETPVADNKNNKINDKAINGTPDTAVKNDISNNELTANNNTPVNNAPVTETVTPKEATANNQGPEEKPVQRPVQNTVSNKNTMQVKNELPVQKTPSPLNNKTNNTLVNNPIPNITNKPSNNLPQSYLQKNNNGDRNESVVKNVPQTNQNNGINNSGINNALVQNNTKEKTNNTVVADINNNTVDPKTTAAVQTVYKPTAPGDNNNNLFDEEGNTKRSKVGGFLRKVKRLVERNTNIRTGNEIKLAGFEIAIK